ncbi:hypothetical protein [Aliarcobacter vitoriensis]|uniref:Uncharacterized protein n=1 Tax=Aliarcobacter vitoriensis TaxID=2011099 RepID=A0A366MUR7_9BACT|nr:hypothetical protein [Aliarcobacter vitoriensis]RBQ30001.1 hypothetical protein CRU91_01615 [Aliarcobacter vitoriensis]RBQ32004.1 hypothetical protein CRU92_04345 [Arcobacter sp. FW59]
MVKNTKKYFSFFGILFATVSRKLLSSCCKIDSVLSKIPKITKELLEKQLKPIKLYSTNNI